MDEAKTLEAVVRHIRNSIAHCHFIHPNENAKTTSKITELTFIDQLNDSPSSPKTFEYKTGVEDFKKFLLEVSNLILKNEKTSNQ